MSALPHVFSPILKQVESLTTCKFKQEDVNRGLIVPLSRVVQMFWSDETVEIDTFKTMWLIKQLQEL